MLVRVMSSDIALDPDEEEAVHATFGDRLADRVAAVEAILPQKGKA